MKRLITTAVFAAIPLTPSVGHAQVDGHFSASLGLGLSTHGYSTYGTRVGFGLSFGIGLGFSFHDRDPYHDGYLFGVHDPPWPRYVHCRDSFWYDPFQPCHGYFPVGYSGWGYPGWYGPWSFGFLGWPSPRYLRSHWWSPPFWAGYHSPFWADDYAWGFGRHGWGYGYDRWDPYYPAYTPYYDYVDPRARVVRRSPLYGPRYKEYPTPPVYVTDNGPERPVSRAVPRSVGPGGTLDGTDGYRGGRRARLTDAPRSARPRTGTDARAARPRTGAGAAASPPRVRARPQPSTRTAPGARPRTSVGRVSPPAVRRAPTARPAPGVRSTPSRRPSPTARPAPSSRRPSPAVRSAPSSRRPSPMARPAPSSRRPSPMARSAPSSRRPSPMVRSAPSRASAPKARPAPSRAPTPKMRSAPSRAPRPSVRAAPRGSGSRKAPPRRPARRPGA